MEQNKPTTITFSRWTVWLCSIVYIISAIVLLIGKLFFHWEVDSISVVLFLIVWIPLILPLLRRVKYKEVEIEFVERVKEVQADVAKIGNEMEIKRDETKVGVLNTKTDPNKIRLRYTSQRIDSRYFKVKVWLDAPERFLAQVEKVIYEHHPTFTRRFKESSVIPFEDSFRCWGEFTIRGEIKLKNGESLRRQKYLSLEKDLTDFEGDETEAI